MAMESQPPLGGDLCSLPGIGLAKMTMESWSSFGGLRVVEVPPGIRLAKMAVESRPPFDGVVQLPSQNREGWGDLR